MEISNLRKIQKDSKTYLIVDINCKFSNKSELWFSIDSQYEEWFSDDTYDAFLIAAIYMAMYYNENIYIDGKVSKKVLRNLKKYIMPVITSLNPLFKDISITTDGYTEPKKADLNIIGTGYSGGVDSFSTICDNYENEKDPEYKINTLFFFNVGQYVGENQEVRRIHADQFYQNGLLFAKEIGLPYIFLDSNLFDFYKKEWEYDAGPLCRLAAILSLQRVIKRYYISGSNHYLQQNSSIDKHLDDVTDEFIYSYLSPSSIDIILDGNQYYRSEKLVTLSNYQPTKKHLNVCVNSEINVYKDKNCSICHKCCRTLIILEALGLLQEYSNVFNIEKYYSVKKEYLYRIRLDYKTGAFAHENIDFIRSYGMKVPSYLKAYVGLFLIRLRRKILQYP